MAKAARTPKCLSDLHHITNRFCVLSSHQLSVFPPQGRMGSESTACSLVYHHSALQSLRCVSLPQHGIIKRAQCLAPSAWDCEMLASGSWASIPILAHRVHNGRARFLSLICGAVKAVSQDKQIDGSIHGYRTVRGRRGTASCLDVCETGHPSPSILAAGGSSWITGMLVSSSATCPTRPRRQRTAFSSNEQRAARCSCVCHRLGIALASSIDFRRSHGISAFFDYSRTLLLSIVAQATRRRCVR